MSQSPMPSLGDKEPTEYVLVRTEEPLPKGRKELVARFENILSRGGVQKVVIELGRPIQISQLVDRSQAPAAPEQLSDDDLWARAYNKEFEALTVTAPSFGTVDFEPYASLFHAFHSLTTRRLVVKAVYVHHYGALREWLGLGPAFSLEQVFGVDVAVNAEMPEDGVLLVGVSPDPADTETAVGLLVRMDTQRRK